MFTVLNTVITQPWANNGAPLSPFATTGSRSAIVYLKACREATQQNRKKKNIKSLHGSAWAQLKTFLKKNTCLKIEDQKVLSMHSVVSTSRDEASDDT